MCFINFFIFNILEKLIIFNIFLVKLIYKLKFFIIKAKNILKF